MCAPSSMYELKEKEVYSNGMVYEYWHYLIDNEHHIHLPDGTLIIFFHEDSEGAVTIKPPKGVTIP